MVHKWYGADAKVLSVPRYIYVSILKQTKVQNSTQFVKIKQAEFVEVTEMPRLFWLGRW
jgi:hypothetical protein